MSAIAQSHALISRWQTAFAECYDRSIPEITYSNGWFRLHYHRFRRPELAAMIERMRKRKNALEGNR